MKFFRSGWKKCKKDKEKCSAFFSLWLIIFAMRENLIRFPCSLCDVRLPKHTKEKSSSTMTLTDWDPLVSTSLFSSRTPPGWENKAIAATFSRRLHGGRKQPPSSLSLSLFLSRACLPRLRQSINLVTLRRFLSCRGSSWPYFIISSQFNSFVCALQAENNLFIWARNDALTDCWRFDCAVAGEAKFIQHTTDLSARICLQFTEGMLYSVISREPPLHPPALPLRKVYYTASCLNCGSYKW